MSTLYICPEIIFFCKQSRALREHKQQSIRLAAGPVTLSIHASSGSCSILGATYLGKWHNMKYYHVGLWALGLILLHPSSLFPALCAAHWNAEGLVWFLLPLLMQMLGTSPEQRHPPGAVLLYEHPQNNIWCLHKEGWECLGESYTPQPAMEPSQDLHSDVDPRSHQAAKY